MAFIPLTAEYTEAKVSSGMEDYGKVTSCHVSQALELVGQQKYEVEEQFMDLGNCHTVITNIVENNKIRTGLIDGLFNTTADLSAQLNEEQKKIAKLVQEKEFLLENVNDNHQFIQKLTEDNEALKLELAMMKETNKGLKMQVSEEKQFYGFKIKMLNAKRCRRIDHRNMGRISVAFANLEDTNKELSDKHANIQTQNAELTQSNGELQSLATNLATWNEKQLARFMASESHARYLEDLNKGIRATQEGMIREERARMEALLLCLGITREAADEMVRKWKQEQN